MTEAQKSPNIGEFLTINKKIEGTFDDAFVKGMNEHERVLMNVPATQYYRFHELCTFIGDIARPNLQILDVGCGNAEFFKFLNSHGFCGRYHGVDLNAKLLAEGRKRYPGIRLEQRDLLVDPPAAADFAVMSGIFNIDVGQSLDYLKAVVAAAFSVVREKVIFNVISTYVNRRDAGMYYVDPADAVALAAGLSHRFELRHGFLPCNYTVCVHRQDDWQPAL